MPDEQLLDSHQRHAEAPGTTNSVLATSATEIPKHILVCVLCFPDPEVEQICRVLWNRDCPDHGRSWHRRMRLEDGTMIVVPEDRSLRASARQRVIQVGGTE